jgi:hypothetical protein
MPNFRAPNFIKHAFLDLKAQIDPHAVGVGDFNTPLSLIVMSSIKKRKKL